MISIINEGTDQNFGRLGKMLNNLFNEQISNS